MIDNKNVSFSERDKEFNNVGYVIGREKYEKSTILRENTENKEMQNITGENKGLWKTQ